ncbi:hypothetical protein [Adlercreutzia shanghongiae]|uniref:Beta-carotene 15,15'-monooxygenase n=1 Tax=Adlercreutzia shanghongiae TaxID=3111773 RepID=A0ABU6IVW4_9ACTN|nr:hypothetical protein [Adlercreutzia sp. R22]MEC4293969.1 hypothetical protein [Adlercreutzia sp. R22]
MIDRNVALKESLRAHYKRTAAPVDEAEKARVAAMVRGEAARWSSGMSVDGALFWRFVVGQLRFVSPVAWAMQVALLAGMLAVTGILHGSSSSMLVVMASAVLSVAFAVPSVFKSFEHDVAELEASCRHDSAQVLASRLVLFGLADVLWMSAAVWLVPTLAGEEPFRIFLYAATPFFAFCAICFHLSRMMRGRCVKACAVAAACALAALWGAGAIVPHWYAEMSMAVWVLALAAALALAVHEARRLVLQVAQDGASPLPAPVLL